jgi:tryptophan synthase beta chain
MPLNDASIELGGHPLGGILRRARRTADLSQRELAERAELSHSAVGSFETGRATPTLPVLVRLLAAADYQLVVVDKHGRLVLPMKVYDDVTDLAGRRFPTHLDTIIDPKYGEWWADVYGLTAPPETFRRSRAFRDWQRRQSRWETRAKLLRGVRPPKKPRGESGWERDSGPGVELTPVDCEPCGSRDATGDGTADAVPNPPHRPPGAVMSTSSAVPAEPQQPRPTVPDATGHFGPYGGRFVPEALVAAIDDLTAAFTETQADPAFRAELARLHRDYTGRPSPLTDVPKFSEHAGGARLLLKREDLNHTGSHKINNVLGQALLTQKIGKKRVIAETGAGQHGVATATAAALLGLDCTVYMGEEDTRRQALNVARMRLLGAEVLPVTTGSRTLKDAINEAMRDWVTNVETTNYVFGTVAGPHPFPLMVREYQRIIGDEARDQVLERVGRLPDVVAACVGGGSNAIGIFTAFVPDAGVRLVGFEAGGDGLETGRHAASITGGAPGVLHGARSYLLQDDNGQTIESHSISAGLDYPGVGPEHSYLHDIGRAEYRPITDAQAMAAFSLLSRSEGIIPAIESAHALAGALELGHELGPDAVILVNLSGRGDKDVETAARWFDLAPAETPQARGAKPGDPTGVRP